MAVPNQWKPKINRHVSYRTAGGKRKPGIITALPGGTNVTIRVVHKGETHANVAPGKGSNQYRAG